MDYLDAQRTFIAANLEYIQDLTAYWTAVAQLEAAVGMEFRK
jgi:outer membrane protein TolC